MNKLLIAATLSFLLGQTAWALTVEDRLVAGLQAQGYTVLERGYTFLGRLRIVAESDEIHREIVVNPGTGEILRDYAVYLSDMAPPDAPVSTRVGKATTPSRDPAPSNRTAENDDPTRTPTGTAGAAVSSLPAGSSTLGSSSLQVDTSPDKFTVPLDATILPMTSGTP